MSAGLDRLLGSEFSGYRIVRKLGEGGMGAVFEALEVNLDRRVALKVLLPLLSSDDNLIERFKREAKAVARLSHANIVQVHRLDRTPEGLFFIAMEYCGGGSVASLVGGREAGSPPIDEAEAARIIGEAATGLAAAWTQARVIHRDIKPDNLLFGADGTVKIADFGLASAADLSEGLTRTGTIMGTPPYMPPEQWMDVRTCDHRSDLYSLGCTLYVLLAGRKPFPGPAGVNYANQHLNEPAPDVRAARADASEGIAAIIARLLAKEPADRFQSGDDLTAALEAAHRRAGATARRTTVRSPEAVPPAPPSRGGFAQAAIAVVSIAALAAGGWLTRDRWLPAPAPHERAAEPVAAERVASSPEAPAASPGAEPPRPAAIAEDPRPAPPAPEPVAATLAAATLEPAAPPKEAATPTAAPVPPAAAPPPAQPPPLLADSFHVRTPPPVVVPGSGEGTFDVRITGPEATYLLAGSVRVSLPPDAAVSGSRFELLDAGERDFAGVRQAVADVGPTGAVLRVLVRVAPDASPGRREIPALIAYQGRTREAAFAPAERTVVLPLDIAGPRLGWHGEPLPDRLGKGERDKDYVWDEDGAVLVYVRAGRFRMGTDEIFADTESRPAHDVAVDAFYIGKYEVTWRQWKASSLGSPAAPSWGIRDDHPVVNVTWESAKAYCERSGLRLPTEAEWEYAARGPAARNYPWGGEQPNDRRANYDAREGLVFKTGTFRGQTAPVGSYPDGASWCGALDLAGNVWEWCEDAYDPAYYARSPASNPRNDAPAPLRANRGGSWQWGPLGLPAYVRGEAAPSSATPEVGFRVALSARPR